MPADARCPSCRAACPVTDEDIGKKVRCPRCEEVFTVKAKTIKLDEDDDDSPWLQDADAAKGKGQEERTGGRARRGKGADKADRDDDPDEEAPRRKKTRRVDDDDDEPPRRPSSVAKKKRGRTGLIVGLVTGAAFVLLLCCGVGGYFAWTRFSDNPLVTAGNFERVQLNAPLANIEGFFGPGRSWSGADVKALLDDHRLNLPGNNHIKAVAANPQGFGITQWYRWTNGPTTMFVGVDGAGKVRIAGLVTISSNGTQTNLRSSV